MAESFTWPSFERPRGRCRTIGRETRTFAEVGERLALGPEYAFFLLSTT